MRSNHEQAHDHQRNQQMLSAVAQHMKLPLLYMRQHAELVRSGAEFSPDIIETAADSGMLLIENYLHWQRVAEQGESLDMHQSSLSSLLYDVAHSLERIAKSYNAQVQLDISGKYGPVMTHQRTLEAALVSLGLSYIEAAQDDSPVVLGVHRSRWGIVAGVYSHSNNVSAEMFKCGQRLVGRSLQPMPIVSHSSMSGFLIAAGLLDVLSTRLRVAKHRGMQGLATTLTPNPQLALL